MGSTGMGGHCRQAQGWEVTVGRELGTSDVGMACLSVCVPN